jgi:hypothetical protein
MLQKFILFTFQVSCLAGSEAPTAVKDTDEDPRWEQSDPSFSILFLSPVLIEFVSSKKTVLNKKN